MENELKFNYLDPEEPLHEGLQNKKWISKEEMFESFPNQPERSKREDTFEGTRTYVKISGTYTIECFYYGKSDAVL